MIDMSMTKAKMLQDYEKLDRAYDELMARFDDNQKKLERAQTAYHEAVEQRDQALNGFRIVLDKPVDMQPDDTHPCGTNCVCLNTDNMDTKHLMELLLIADKLITDLKRQYAQAHGAIRITDAMKNFSAELDRLKGGTE